MTISITIPCRNEVNYIAECLQAIYKCSLPENCDISVYVVDGMSDDGTREVVKKLCETYDSLHLIDNEKQLTPYAFNLGIRAGGEVDYVQIIGARHIVSTNYLTKSLEILQGKNDVWCVGGRIINEYVNSTGEIISKAMSTAFGMGIGNFRTLEESGYTDTVTSPMYPFWVFEKIGYFDEELVRNQDDDFNFRVHKAGGKIYYEHAISLKYYVRGNYSGLYRQFFQYGYWKVYVNQKHKSVTTLRQLVPPTFVFYLMLILPSFLIGIYFGSFFSFPLICYVALNTFFSIKLAKNFEEFGSIFKTYLILHISYGLGYLKGMYEFLLLRKKPSETEKRLSR